jgi:hypothetical protein
MKKLFSFLLFSLFILQTLSWAGNRINPAKNPRIVNGKIEWNGNVTWYKKVQAPGQTDSLYTPGVDEPASRETSGWIVGAHDSLYSDTFVNKGVASAQVTVTGGTTVRLQIIVQTVNTGDSTLRTLGDADFKNTYWIVSGAGRSSSYANTQQDSVLAAGKTLPISIPLSGCGAFRFFIDSSGAHVGNCKVRIALKLRED